MSNSHFCSNDLGKKPNYQYQAGLTLRNSELVSLKGSTLYNNEISQIGVIGVKGGIQVNNWETGQLYNLRTQNFTLEGQRDRRRREHPAGFQRQLPGRYRLDDLSDYSELKQ